VFYLVDFTMPKSRKTSKSTIKTPGGFYDDKVRLANAPHVRVWQGERRMKKGSPARKSKANMLSNRQTLEYLIAFLPNEVRDAATANLEATLPRYNEARSSDPHPLVDQPMMMKLPLSFVRKIFANTGYALVTSDERKSMCKNNMLGVELACIMDVIAERVLINTDKCGSIPAITTVKDKEKLDSKRDHEFRRLVGYSPGTTYFRDSHRRNDRFLKTCWLKHDKDSGTVHDGSYVRHIMSTVFIVKRPAAQNGDQRITSTDATIKTINARQVHTSHPDSPFLMVDNYKLPGEVGRKSHAVSDPYAEHERAFYRGALSRSTTNKTGCRRYVKGAHFHSNPADTSAKAGGKAFVLEPKKGETVKLFVAVEDEGSNVIEKSVITVRNTVNHGYLQKIVNLGNIVVQKKPVSARSKSGDDGTMATIGQSYNFGGEHTYVLTDDIDQGMLDDISIAARRENDLHFPVEAQAIRNAFPTPPPQSLGGIHGLAQSLILSVDLCNAPHVDPSDVTYGISTWASNDPAALTNWLFVFPDIIVEDPKTGEFHCGLVVELGHGVQIAWDGRVIRHCTAKTRFAHKSAHAFSLFMTSNGQLCKLKFDQLPLPK